MPIQRAHFVPLHRAGQLLAHTTPVWLHSHGEKKLPLTYSTMQSPSLKNDVPRSALRLLPFHGGPLAFRVRTSVGAISHTSFVSEKNMM